MLLDLSDVLNQNGQAIVRDFRLVDGEVEGVRLAKPVKGEVRIQNARRNLVVSGTAQATVELPCARCLQFFPYSLPLTLETVLPLSLFHMPGQSSVSEPDDAEDEVLADAEMHLLFEEHSFNIAELVRQTIWLQTPINPLCREDCKGIAPDLETGFTGDIRLEKLKEWAN